MKYSPSPSSIKSKSRKTDASLNTKRDKTIESTKVTLTTRDEFLAIVSHDLKNPIGAASMCAEILLENPLFQETGTEVRKWLNLIKRNIDTSLRLIDDLLDMERIEKGKLQLKLEKYETNLLLREIHDSFLSLAKAKAVHLQLLPTIRRREIRCDKDRIMQVLSNLIGNALKFTPQGGTITLDSTSLEGAIRFSISDTGSGIPEDKRNQIFERYAQLGANDRMGMGLGLYISHMLVEAHHGKLWVSSQLGSGSTFYFTIPN